MKTKQLFSVLAIAAVVIIAGCSKENQDVAKQQNQKPTEQDRALALSKLPERGHSRSCVIPEGSTPSINLNSRKKASDIMLNLVYVPENYYPIREPQDPWFDPYVAGLLQGSFCAPANNKIEVDWWSYNGYSDQWTSLINYKQYNCISEVSRYTKNVVMKEGVQFEPRHWELLECDIWQLDTNTGVYTFLGTISSDWVWTGEIVP